MKIKRFSYKNKATGWELAPMEFGDFNLLVGASGVGKSKILQAIGDVQRIAQAGLAADLAWKIEFIVDDEEYCWQGEIGQVTKFSSGSIKMEEMKSDNITVKRQLGEVTIGDTVLPVQLNQSQSIVTLFQQDKRIKPIFEGFKNMEFLVMPESMYSQKFEEQEAELIVTGSTSLEDIQNSNYSIHTKLVMARFKQPDIFQQITEDFTALFPNIGKIMISKNILQGIAADSWGAFFSFEFCLQEIGVEVEIEQKDISTGMMKTLLLIGAVYLSAPGTVILIDEFENSLGVNCIDIFDKLDYQRSDLQFIITSHHPYIINNVPMVDWKIVTRKGSVVTVKNAVDFNLGKSKHTAFKQLLQLDEFNEGIILS